MISDFGSTNNVAVVVLVDNRADLLVRSTETVIRFQDEPLLAEHGFSAMIELRDEGHRILWDAGMSDAALLENMRRMKIDPASIDIIALSHGHGDHTGAMTRIIQAMERRPSGRKWEKDATAAELLEWARGRPVPLVAHPAAFRERWSFSDDGTKYGPIVATPMLEWQAAGAEIILSEGPYRLGPGCWTTGAVPRRSFESAGRSGGRFYREGDAFLADGLEDDQAVVINVAGKGLVIVAGCAHSGIVNTVRHAREISGVDKIHAILGGFHLAPAKDGEMKRTISEIQEMAPAMIAPTHCTGFRATAAFAEQMPEQFELCLVGTTFLF
jgi:7,8-dihydropterin-6-yl-methyl-4-(beta-D-ribofuranosyl)aminobenzene 5'-phosphate synthase